MSQFHHSPTTDFEALASTGSEDPPTLSEQSARKPPKVPVIIARRYEADRLAELPRVQASTSGAPQTGEPDRLEVPPTHRGLLFIDGRYAATLPPGHYPLEEMRRHGADEGLGGQNQGNTSASPTAATLIVVDDGEFTLDLVIDDLLSSEPHQVQLKAQLAVRLADAEIFLANLLRGHTIFDSVQLADFLRSEVGDALRPWVAALPAAELDGGGVHGGRVRAQLEMELLSRWKTSFERCGFILQRFRVLRCEVPSLDRGRERLAEAGDARMEGEVGRRAQRILFEAELENLRLDMDHRRLKGVEDEKNERLETELQVAKLDRDVDRLRRRAPLFQELLQGTQIERMASLESEEEWRKLRYQVDRQRLLDDGEWATLQQETAQKTGTAKARQQFLWKRLLSQAEAEFEELQLKQRYRLKLLEMRGDRAVIEEETRRHLANLERELESRRRVFEQEMQERDRWLNREHDEQKNAADVQLYQLEKMETIRQMGKDQEGARRLAAQAAEAELARLQLAAEKEAYGDLSPDHILSMAVARHPERAREIAEAFRAAQSGTAGEREIQLFERMLEEIKTVLGRTQTLDHEKFAAVQETAARQQAQHASRDEAEKDRLESVTVASLGGAPLRQGTWRRCPNHEIKYPADRPCPLCHSEGEET